MSPNDAGLSLLDPDVLNWLISSGSLDDALVELYDVRRMIETEAAGMAAEMASPKDIDQIRAAFDRMSREPTSMQDALDADVAFHKAVIAASGNRFIGSLAIVCETALRATVKLSVRRPGGLPHSLPQHLVVLRQIEARNAEGARAGMRALIQNAQSDAIDVARDRRRAVAQC